MTETTARDAPRHDSIFSSDVTRAQRTAEVIALERKMAVGTSKLLRERNWGRYGGVAAQRYREECRELIERYNALSQEQRWSFKYFEEIFARFITVIGVMQIEETRGTEFGQRK